MRLFSAVFWKAALPRAERSFAQGAIVGAGHGSVAADVALISWQAAVHGLAVGASVAVLSILTALAAAPPEEGDG